MSFTFAKVKIDKLVYPWMLVIDNLQDLERYEKVAFAPQRLSHYMHDGWDAAAGKSHSTTPIGMLVEMKLYMGGISPLEAIGSITNEVILAKRRILHRAGKIYINSAGGFFPHNPKVVVIEEMEVDSLIFPCFSKDDIRVSKWPNGTHWYAYIGEIQVVDKDGDDKWNTEEEAMKQAEYYLYYANRKQFIPKVNHSEEFVHEHRGAVR